MTPLIYLGAMVVGYWVLRLTYWFVADRIRDARRRRRGEEIAQLAARLGLSVTAADPSGARIDKRFQFFQESDPAATNILTGSYGGGPVEAFDYRYSFRTRRSSEEVRKSVVSLEMPTRTPYVSVHEKSLFDDIAHFLGFPDLPLGVKAFDDRFRVKCQEPDVALRLLRGLVADHILQRPHRPHQLIELCDGRLVVTEREAAVTEIEGLVAFACGLRAKLIATERGVATSASAPTRG